MGVSYRIGDVSPIMFGRALISTIAYRAVLVNS
jgi:hypothetical protein